MAETPLSPHQVYKKGDIQIEFDRMPGWKIRSDLLFKISLREKKKHLLNLLYKEGSIFVHAKTKVGPEPHYYFIEDEKVYLSKYPPETTTFTMRLRANKKADFNNLPEKLKISLQYEEHELDSFEVSFESNWFFEHLFCVPLGEEENDTDFREILLFGEPQSGKSTFINTLITSFTDMDSPCSQVQCGGSRTHVTTALKGYRIVENKTDDDDDDESPLKCMKYRLWDTWGLNINSNSKDEEKGNSANEMYSGDDFEKILKGEVVSGWTMFKNEDRTKYEIGPTRDQRLKKCCVVFFIDTANTFQLDTDPYCKVLREFVERVTKMGSQAIILLTKVDKDEYNLDPNAENEDFRETKAKVAQFFHVAETSVYPFQSYYKKTSRDFNIDRLTVNVFLHIMKIADDTRRKY